MRQENGFTLIELIIGMLISGILIAAVYTTYKSQQESYVAHEQIVAVDQNLRAGMYFLQRWIRMVGYDPSSNFGDDATITAAGSNSIAFTREYTESYYDSDKSGDYDAGEPFVDADESGNREVDSLFTIQFSLMDSDGDGTGDALAWNGGGADRMLADNIEAVGFAYAFDNSPEDNQLDTSGGGNTIWAIDSDGDGDLDLNLDTNDDGVIDENDDTDSNGIIDGSAIGGVDLDKIRAVRIWLLGMSDRGGSKVHTATPYVVSNQVLTPSDGIRRRMLSMDIKLRNMGI